MTADRSKIKGKPRLARPPIVPKRNDQTLVPGAGLAEEKLLGRLTMRWAALESTLQSLMWSFLQLSMSDGRIITSKMDAVTLIQMNRALGQRHLLDIYLKPYLDMLNAIDDLREARNLATHGLWSMLYPEQVSTVMSLRLKIDNNVGEIASETFSIARLKEIILNIEREKADVIKLDKNILASRDKWLIPHPKD